ncbi:MAG: radical SAM protein [Candidatus Omnitrophota bacterium]
MKILLIEPPPNSHDIVTGVVGLAEPLALECVASGISEHEVKILDMRIDRNLQRELEKFKPDIVGTTSNVVEVYIAKKLLKEVKKFDSRIFTVIGGHHATLKPKDFFEDFVDTVVIGEGEESFQELTDRLQDDKDISNVRGIAYQKDGKFLITDERPLLNLDDLPFPKRELVEKYRSRYFRASWHPITSLYTSRGCPFRCSFCSMWKVNRGKYRTRSAESVVKELETIPEKYIDFVDDNTLSDVKRAYKLYELIKEKNFKKVYKVYARSDTVAQNPDLIKKWKEIGLELILIGFESFRNEELRKWNKKTNIEQNEEALRILKENNVESAAYFVVDPDFDREDFEELSIYIERKGLTHPIFTIFTPFPGTDIYEEKKKELNRNYELFDFYHAVQPTKLPKKDFYRCFVNLYKRAYSFRRLLRNRRENTAGFSISEVRLKLKYFMRLNNLVRNAEKF